MGYLAIILAFFLVSCSGNSEDKTTGASSAEATNEPGNRSASDLQLESSVTVLKGHISDMQNLASAATEADQGTFASAVTNLVTKYQFEVIGYVESESYREASYFWDKAEKDYVTLEESYNGLSGVDLSGLWSAYQASRNQILELKKLWETQ